MSDDIFTDNVKMQGIAPEATFILDIISVHRYIFCLFTYYFGTIIVSNPVGFRSKNSI
jgi:hypothetical protein